MDEIRYQMYVECADYVILYDKFSKEFVIHSADLENDVAMVTGFLTATKAIEFAEDRIVEAKKEEG